MHVSESATSFTTGVSVKESILSCQFLTHLGPSAEAEHTGRPSLREEHCCGFAYIMSGPHIPLQCKRSMATRDLTRPEMALKVFQKERGEKKILPVGLWYPLHFLFISIFLFLSGTRKLKCSKKQWVVTPTRKVRYRSRWQILACAQVLKNCQGWVLEKLFVI